MRSFSVPPFEETRKGSGSVYKMKGTTSASCNCCCFEHERIIFHLFQVVAYFPTHILGFPLRSFFSFVLKANQLLGPDCASSSVALEYILLIPLLRCDLYLFIYLCFLGPHSQHMEVARLGVELELQLPASTTATATATSDRSRVWDLHHSSRQHWILNALSEARDWTHVFMDTSRVRYNCATMGTPRCDFWSVESTVLSMWMLRFSNITQPSAQSRWRMLPSSPEGPLGLSVFNLTHSLWQLLAYFLVISYKQNLTTRGLLHPVSFTWHNVSEFHPCSRMCHDSIPFSLLKSIPSCGYTIFFGLFMAAPTAYGHSQASGWIGATAEAYPTAIATPDLNCICSLHCSLCHCWILNPLSQPRDQTCVVMDTAFGS